MPAHDGTLKLLKGGAPASGPPRPHRPKRRTVTRRTPPPADPVVEALERLDQEPVAAETPDTTETPDATEAPEPTEAADAETPPVRRSIVERARRRTAAAAARTPRKKAPGRTHERRMTTAAVAVVLCLAVAAAVWFGSRWYGDRTLAQAHQQALAAAKQTTVNFVSVSAASVDKDLQRITAGSTGDFRDEFTRGQAQVRAAIMANNVESHGTVLRAALLSGGRRSAVVLIAMDATVRNTNAPDGRVSHYRMQVSVARDAKTSRWLVSNLQFVG
jgi:Mce-associated membrane protein